MWEADEEKVSGERLVEIIEVSPGAGGGGRQGVKRDAHSVSGWCSHVRRITVRFVGGVQECSGY